jgi:DNA repair exonuclease SbcCD ATPase subunit
MSDLSPFEQRLAALESRYSELGELLSAPDAYQDLDRIEQLSREQSKLREVVEAARRWRDAQEAAREAEEMARAESDPAIVAMAEEEHHDQVAAAEAEYDRLRIPTTIATSLSRFAPGPAVTRQLSSRATCSACMGDMRSACGGASRCSTRTRPRDTVSRRSSSRCMVKVRTRS